MRGPDQIAPKKNLLEQWAGRRTSNLLTQLQSLKGVQVQNIDLSVIKQQIQRDSTLQPPQY